MKPLLTCLLCMTSTLFSAPSPDVAELVKDHREFALSLYPVLEAQQTNLIFSPYSIASNLSMLFIGARNDTALQMEQTLHLGLDRKKLPKAAAALNQSLLSQGKNVQLSLVNALWVDQSLFLLTDFRYAIEQQFMAKLGTLNFSQPAKALSTINDWIAEQTHGKIPSLLKEQDLNAQTSLVLTNAVYFQGNWTQPFDPKATQNGLFHPTPDTNVIVPMMSQTLKTAYYENDLMQAIALPFLGGTSSNGQFAFVVLLPKSADNFTVLFNELSASFENWLNSLKEQLIQLTLPKFQLSSRYDLNGPLQNLGMQDAFSSDANFIGIDGMRDLFLNKIAHQAVFDLDEIGVIATAATTATMSLTSNDSKELPTVMNIDHPFLFFIVDLNSHEMLFIGKIAEPSKI
jgi:serpin B